jgi:DNA-binding response OmpR family regulator
MPGLVLLDINVPRLDGFGVLRKMRAAERTRCVPVVMLSSRLARVFSPGPRSTPGTLGQ